MFFRRILERKDSTNNAMVNAAATGSAMPIDDYSEDNESVTYDSKDSNNNQSHSNGGPVINAHKIQRRTEPQAPMSNIVQPVQLTPLWEHILRTRRLPESISPSSMYAEFNERLQDPEWQVRQHALRVLVDVLVVMRAKADKHMEQLTTQLVENLGHQAPTVRKGALDCLRVYLTETSMPETVMMRIMENGLGQQPLDEPYGGRLTCGVLLSLPALLQSILHTPQRHFIVRQVIGQLVQRRMGQLMQQEITLKVLAKIGELLGVHEFEDYMSKAGAGGKDALPQYLQLCNVYGVTPKSLPNVAAKTGAWRAIPREHSWRGSNTTTPLPQAACPEHSKVIMETEIKINDDTLTMRILEADTETEDQDELDEAEAQKTDIKSRAYCNSLEGAELICRPMAASGKAQRESDAGILQVISDSEVDESSTTAPIQVVSLTAPNTPSRGLKRVTFGGEVVKMRTPDSDAASSNNKSNDEDSSKNDSNENTNIAANIQEAAYLSSQSGGILAIDQVTPSNSPPISPIAAEEQESPVQNIEALAPTDCKTSMLTLDIPSDNTKPLQRPRTAQSPQRKATVQAELATPSTNNTNTSSSSASPKQQDTNLSLSPQRSPSAYRSRSISPAGSNNISPRVPHKQIEVLHNLQRDPSPRSARTDGRTLELIHSPPPPPVRSGSGLSVESPTTPKSWEDLDIVSYKTIMDLRSGDWRNRLQGIEQLDLALRSSSNLALVQPYLDSLLRTLLSSERNYEVAEEKRELLTNLITRLPLDNLEERTLQILSGLCRQGNAGANRVCNSLMQRLPAGTIVAKLTSPEFLHGKSSKFRDHALQMAIYALLTFPSTCFDINNITAQVSYTALNRKRRVRQAALEVLAVLAEISSAEQIISIVADIAPNVEPGVALLAAIKARLLRRQCAMITPDGTVLYTIHQVEHSGVVRYGPDVEWVAQGEGSASPNAIKRRRMRAAAKQNPKEATQGKIPLETGNNYNSDESLQRHSFHSPPETYDMTSPTNSSRIHLGPKRPNAFHSNYIERRLVGKTFSETSMDGRSTDSTTTTCSSGSGSFVQLTPRNACHTGRLNKQNSRFPAMNQHMDYVNNFMRNVQRASSHHYGFDGSAGYPKVNYTMPKTQHQHPHQQQRKKLLHQHSLTQLSRPANASQSQANFKVNEIQSRKQRSISVDDLVKEGSNNLRVTEMAKTEAKHGITSPMNTPAKQLSTQLPEQEGSPLSVKSTSYSQKSTASAKSNNSSNPSPSQSVGSGMLSKPQPVELLQEQQPVNASESLNELTVDDIEEQPNTELIAHEVESALKRNESVSSLQSKTESIKTQLEDNTPQLSRAQSQKSLAIEEEIEDSNSFVVMEELQQELQSSGIEALAANQLLEEVVPNARAASSSIYARPQKLATQISHDHVRMQSRSMSLESLYDVRPDSKQGSLDTSTTDNSSQAGSQLDNNIPSKLTPLKQKSKTSCFLRNQRRVSPVKQAIKMSRTELFPQSMTRFEKPREALLKTFDQLDSLNWEVNIMGLKSMVRLIRYHGEYLDHHMHMVCIQLTRSVRNLRSQVARAACQAAVELFALKSKYLEAECDDLVCALLHRTADTNRFLRADATRALESMADNVQAPKILGILTTKGAQHQNALVRTTTAKLLFRLVERLGSDRIYSMSRENRDKLLVVCANLLLEGSLETRNYAKSIFRALSDHASYQRLLLEVIPTSTYRNIEKTLRSIAR